jgi:spore coat protein CotH
MNAQGAAKYGVRLMVVLALLCAARTAGAQGQDDFFDDSTVHELRLTLNSKDWSALKQNFKENIYYPTALQWRGVNVSNVGIRSRGLGSRSGTKPGLRIDFNLFDEGQQFLGLKSVVLRNNVQDPSQLHERVGMALFARLGLPAPREAHARLYVNGEYAGLYSIV